MILLALIPVIAFLIYCPLLCYLDVKYRDIISNKLWIPIIAFNVPFLVAGYLYRIYPWELAIVSFLAVFCWFMLVFLDSLSGADFWWLTIISTFIVVNPFTGHPFMISFSFFLIGMTAATFWAIFIDNLIRKRELSLRTERGIPFLVPICCALIFALVVS